MLMEKDRKHTCMHKDTHMHTHMRVYTHVQIIQWGRGPGRKCPKLTALN